MPSLSKMMIEVPSDYGYVILSAVFSIFVASYLGARVGGARKKYNVALPLMYDHANPQNPFNAIQRGHQNMLETHYAILFSLAVSGLRYPRMAAGLGVAWSIGRIFYARGYTSENPNARYKNPLTPILVLGSALGLICGTIDVALRLTGLY